MRLWNDQKGWNDTYITSTLTTHNGARSLPYSRPPRQPVTDDADECVWWAWTVICCWCNKSVNCFCLTVSSTVLAWASSLMLKLSRQFCAMLSVLRSCALVKLCSGVSRTSVRTLARVALAFAIWRTCFCSVKSAKASLSPSGAGAFLWRRGMAGCKCRSQTWVLMLPVAVNKIVWWQSSALSVHRYLSKGWLGGGEPSRGTPWWLPFIGIGYHPCIPCD